MTTKGKLLIGALWASSLVIASAGAGLASTLITGKQIKDGSLTGRDIRNGSIHRIDLARNARVADLAGLQLVTKVGQPPGAYGLPSAIVARCPHGKKVVGGGYSASVSANVNQSRPTAHLTGWLVEASGGFSPPPPYGTGENSGATAYAICVKAR